MAEDQDEASKTEEPTPKRLREAAERGQVPKSQELNHWFIILALSVIVMGFIGGIGTALFGTLRGIVEKPHAFDMDGNALVDLMGLVVEAVALAMLLPLGFAVVAAFSANLCQNGFMFTPKAIEPKWEKLNPIKGLKRLFSMRSIVELAKGVIKLGIIGTVVALVVIPDFDQLPFLITVEAPTMLAFLQDEATKVLLAVLLVMSVIALMDLLYQRYDHNKTLKMTKQEVKDEMKQTEGDPQVKQRIRQLRVERARQRMMTAVPQADVVVTNPTHFACALKYDQETMAAPKLIAKGADLVAKRIRDLADEHDIPRVENPPLAQALYATVDVDEEIPPEHYQAVAEVIGYVMRLKHGAQGSRAYQPAGGPSAGAQAPGGQTA